MMTMTLPRGGARRLRSGRADRGECRVFRPRDMALLSGDRGRARFGDQAALADVADVRLRAIRARCSERRRFRLQLVECLFFVEHVERGQSDRARRADCPVGMAVEETFESS